jgi:hypothetical protein
MPLEAGDMPQNDHRGSLKQKLPPQIVELLESFAKNDPNPGRDTIAQMAQDLYVDESVSGNCCRSSDQSGLLRVYYASYNYRVSYEQCGMGCAASGSFRPLVLRFQRTGIFADPG